jgi:hypothetical protein
LISKNSTYSDPNFNKDNMIYWGDFGPDSPQQALKVKSLAVDGWDRLFNRYPYNTLFGVNGVDI